jgi:hypothetical protein
MLFRIVIFSTRQNLQVRVKNFHFRHIGFSERTRHESSRKHVPIFSLFPTPIDPQRDLYVHRIFQVVQTVR